MYKASVACINMMTLFTLSIIVLCNTTIEYNTVYWHKQLLLAITVQCMDKLQTRPSRRSRKYLHGTIQYNEYIHIYNALSVDTYIFAKFKCFVYIFT
jgi:hypothetical protein